MSNGIFIPIRVGTDELTAATRQLQEFDRLRNEVFNRGGRSPSAPLPTSFSLTPEQERAVKQMEQMQGSSTSVSMPQVDAKGFQAIDAAAARTYKTMSGWESAAKKARAELQKISAEIKSAEKNSLNPGISAITRSQLLDQQQELDERRKRIEKQAAAAEGKAEAYRSKLPEGYQHIDPQRVPRPEQDSHRNRPSRNQNQIHHHHLIVRRHTKSLKPATMNVQDMSASTKQAVLTFQRFGCGTTTPQTEETPYLTRHGQRAALG